MRFNVSAQKGRAVVAERLELRARKYNTMVCCGWTGGWWRGEGEGGMVLYFGEEEEEEEEGGQQRASSSDLLFTILRTDSALHAHQILLLFISAAQKPANQPDQDHQAG